jgi:hypothetical protein
MRNIYKYTLLLMLTYFASSCNLGEFDEDVTTNPNAVSTAFTGNLLTSALRSLPGTTNGGDPMYWMQYIANSQYQDGADTYATERFDFSGWYTGPLADLERIIILNTDDATKGDALPFGKNENQIAVAQILQSYYYLNITDDWGMAPYSDALGALSGNVLPPAYDTQEDIYDGIFATLKSAIANMVGTTDADLGKSDFLLNGNLTRWKQFANTMRLHMALTLSEVDPTRGSTEFNAALAADGGVIPLDDGDIIYKHLADAANQSAWFARFASRRDHTVANTIINMMQTTAYVDPHDGKTGALDVAMDPRISIYADPATNYVNDLQYVGMLFGIGTTLAGPILNDEVSFFGTALRQQDSPEYIYTSANLNFAMAEARKLGWITTGPTTQQYYEAGILQSMRQRGVAGVADADYDTYMTNSVVVFNDTYEQILTQKWLANFPRGHVAWKDWRRTGFPVLEKASLTQNPLDGNVFPVRYGYGGNTIDLNPAGYAAAVAVQGPDNKATPVWWDN